MKKILTKFNSFLKKISKKSLFLLRLYQYLRAVRLLFNKSFRALFFSTKKGDVCIDIGANIGDASLIFWLKGAKIIYAIEPHPIAFEELQNNLKGIKNIKLFNLAISDTNGLDKLYLHQEVHKDNNDKTLLKFSQSSSLVSAKNNLGKSFFEIKTSTIQDFLGICRYKPTIIKCDIEGAEYEIYRDLVNIAKNRELRILLIECHSHNYPKFKESHKNFIDEINKNNLNRKFDLSWH